MKPSPIQRSRAVEWSVASRAAPGETVAGDLYVVTTWEGGALVGVVDGLGHGDEARVAALAAVEELEARAREPVVALVQHCHRALRETRGVVMTLLSFNTHDQTVTSLGIGNVETTMIRFNGGGKPRRESVLLRGGVVGYQLPALQASVWPVEMGDLAVFATDGVREDFSDLINVTEPLPRLVERIIELKFRGADDALVLACKYTGGS